MTKGPWFQDRGIGTIFLLPVSWEGWLALLALVLMLLGSAWVPETHAKMFRIVVVGAYLVLSFLKSERV